MATPGEPFEVASGGVTVAGEAAGEGPPVVLLHGLTELSMGTSQDYRVAAEEGATIVRLGTGLYA